MRQVPLFWENSMTDQRESHTMSRRSFLKLLSLGAATGATIGLVLTRWTGKRSRKNPFAMDLPGQGSIFEPLKDRRLADWLRNRGKNQS